MSTHFFPKNGFFKLHWRKRWLTKATRAWGGKKGSPFAKTALACSGIKPPVPLEAVIQTEFEGACTEAFQVRVLVKFKVRVAPVLSSAKEADLLCEGILHA